jgi:GT2 family glycosyltransferase
MAASEGFASPSLSLHKMPDSSLIIITLNRAEILARTLAGLAKQTRPVDEVIVIDNGPDQATADTVRSFPARYVAEPRRGYGAARNRGLAEARGRILYFLDDDCIAEPEWAETLSKPVAAGEADLVGGSRGIGQTGLAARLEYLSTDGPVMAPGLKRAPARHLSTSNLILRREVADKIGAFDESLAMCEDRDFTTRARLAGFRLLFEPAARVMHYPPTCSLSQYVSRMRHYGFGTSQYFLRWRDEERLARIFPRSAAARLMLLPALAAAGAGYLVARNLPQCPDAILLSPLLLAGQFGWHWGGYQAMLKERQRSCARSAVTKC